MRESGQLAGLIVEFDEDVRLQAQGADNHREGDGDGREQYGHHQGGVGMAGR